MPDIAAREREIVLPDEAIVFRLAKIDNTFPASSRKPLAKHFSLSSEDEKSGRSLLTVWDLGRKTPDEARALLTTPGERIAFSLSVGEIHKIVLPSGEKPLSVVRDDDVYYGHCGILGLNRKAKNERKALYDKLVEIARPI